ncbi:MAG: hypothetical protein NTU61_05790, partial [Candidatus Altiarchaeota archaeon]|nr:hypothetical protein [Candidatus Altiarchaeota archaeon]
MDVESLASTIALEEITLALLILAASVAIGLVVREFIKNHAHRFTKFTKTTVDDEFLAALEKPVYLGIILVGLYFAVMSISLSWQYAPEMEKVAKILGILLVAYTAARLINAVFSWYMKEVAPKTKSTFDEKYLPFFRKAGHIVVYSITFIIIL